ncbi:cytochrome c biogenesis protein CcsA [uncultured Aquimarina sp.]|uniref:cytochrome c biogenesis protein n=1 Tax=uncultured Aquimarina sp. TaxID=575652 RepID=UPI0026132CCE|nr:cytochrome c biogenesis protein CcsA [uncultured Aquimarina sp.]
MKNKFIYSIILFLFVATPSLSGQQLHNLTTYELIERQLINEIHAEKIAKIQIQDFQGRIKPISTLSLELLRKIYGKSRFTYLDKEHNKKKLSPTQVFIGMQYKPDSWQLLELIKIEKKAIHELNHLIEINNSGHSSVSQFFDFQGNYKLKHLVNKAYSKAPGKRSAFDKDIIKIDERVNIIWGIFNGQFLKIFPDKNDSNQKWLCPIDTDSNFQKEDQLFFDKIIPTYFENLSNAIKTNDWTKPDETIELINKFQKENGDSIILSENKINTEIWFNNNPIFLWCLIGYSLLGTLLIILSFWQIFKDQNKFLKKLIKIILIAIFLIFITHGSGIIIRWYISNHAPWSNGYEATIFIAWIGMLAGFIFQKNSSFAPAASSILAICLIGIAHGSLMNPEITNLVPVLKSYWLLIHVAVITASYGFLALGSLLSLITLLIMCFQVFWNTTNAEKTIHRLTNTNQLTSTIGLYMLTIGTFLGGIWANESWGRYWGWDPKETWALISIIIYSFVLHLRIIFQKNYIYIFNVCNLFALSSLIMTFFGVNYYLSGLHSYAKGDPFPIPYWIYIIIPIALLISIIPIYRKRFN